MTTESSGSEPIQVVGEPVAVPKLPTFGMKDGDQILDGNGNIYEYNAEEGEWIYRGIITIPDVVTLDKNGLVYPAAFRRLELIQELIDRGIDFGLFKLDTPGDVPYYYFFYSPDDLIRFYPETGSQLRIEVDRNRIYQKLLRSCCAGPKGSAGAKGASGRNGIAASNEQFRMPKSITAGEFEIDTTVSAPIDTQISVRLFRDETMLVEYLLDINGGSDIITINGAGNIDLTEEEKAAAELEAEARGSYEEGDINGAIEKLNEIIALNVGVEQAQNIIDSLLANGTWPEEQSPLQIIIYDDNIDVDLTGTQLNYDSNTNRLWGVFAFTKGADDIASWKYKARQRGPKGLSGADGDPFIATTEQVLDDPEIRSNTAITSLRKSDLTNTITYLQSNLPSDVCVSKLAISSSIIPVGDLLSAKFAAVKTTTRRCKDIGYYAYEDQELRTAYVHPQLDLPAWEPTADCVTASRFSSYKFEWWDITDPKYPFKIFVPPRPKEQCCQEPFFWCPNVGDNPCGVNHWRCGKQEQLQSGAANAQGLSCDGTARVPIINTPKLPPPECDCDCDSPISYELQNGGLSHGIINLGPSQSQQNYSSNEVSVIDSRVDIYKANFKSTGPIEIVVDLSWDPNVCGGVDQEPKNCQYRDDCAVHSTIVFEDNNNNAEISGGGVAELSSIPGSKTFAIKPLSGSNLDVVINIMINDTQSQCCRGYEIRLGAAYTGSDIKTQKSESNVQVIHGLLPS